ncbi:MAG: serpin family protein, partial [Nanoarchaeota archaeon]|nr:serpin family protein [Nanoarchaeota archaeon]
VEEKTEDLIKDLIPEGVITPLTRLVLTNAIYFKGTWVWQFDEEDTHEREFRVSGTETAQADMMYMANPKARYNYAETDELKILEMMYEGEELSMLLLLPKEDDLSGLEGSLSVDKLDGWKQLLRERKVSVFIPKFKFETKYFMADDLKEMGMPSAFDLPVRFGGPADFSGMTNDKDLSITEVIHQAFVEVNEEGTEAAAATGVVIGTTSAGDSLVFMADHPFIFIIQQRDSGNILFMGRVTDPT